ncbi:MAG: NAD(P)H-dependent flavin oxidoreductase [Acetobacter sp.]|uniref:NAD(P)H-dependent flavin oxidoreductase n=1 Tax=Acetobacter sp. TaxID=440 RepID=UPI003F9240FD
MWEKLPLTLPLIQAPMAGVATPALAAAVSNAGGLGSLGLGASTVVQARQMVAALKAQTHGPFNLNVFIHAAPQRDVAREQAWLKQAGSVFEKFGATPPSILQEIYTSSLDNPEMVRLLVEERPAVVSFHFGVPSAAICAALKAEGIFLLATATCLREAQLLEKAGIDAIIAQGFEAGGHRGMFDPNSPDDQLSTLVLTRLLVRACQVPIIAAGGIMDGYGMAAARASGAVASQLGTAFIGCPESAADAAYRAALIGPGAYHTRMTPVISGRPARTLPNRFMEHFGERPVHEVPAYPVAYDAAKALHAAAKAHGEYGFVAQWAGQGAPLARTLPAAELVAVLMREAGGISL